jgi:RNA polymerase sigma-70 factor (ECF subfamily)
VDIKDLIEGCKKGDPASQRALYTTHSYKMMGVCLRYARSREEAEDMLQETFIKVFSKIHTFKNEGSLEGWIRRIAVTTAINHYHSRKTKFNFTPYEEVEYTNSSSHTSGEVLDQLEAEELLDIINELPEGYRVILNLYAIEGYSHKEIADMLTISEGTSKSQLSRGKKMLETLLTRKNALSND